MASLTTGLITLAEAESIKPFEAVSSNPTIEVGCLCDNITSVSQIAQSNEGLISSREARNLAEKQRRDKLNASINELAKMVPHVVDAPRRMDKTAVLRFATHGLRLQYVFGKTATKRLNRHKIRNHHQSMTSSLLKLLDTFFITLTCHGQIVLVSSTVEQLLGYSHYDLYGQNIQQFVHPDDEELLREQLLPKNLEHLFTNIPIEHHDYYQMMDNINEKLQKDKRSFTVRLARATSRSGDGGKNYEFVKFDGCFRRSDCTCETGENYPIVSQLIRRSRYNDGVFVRGDHLSTSNCTSNDAMIQAAMHGISGNDIVLIAMARIIRPVKVINWPLEANHLEYKTRHLIDGRIIECDQRISLVAGYLKEEVCNLSPFSFMHQDDVRWVIVALRQMYDCNSNYGESYFRLLSRNGNFIYLHTRGYLEIDSHTNKVHSFVCINTLLDERDGRRKVQEMKEKFSIIINAKVPVNSRMQDIPASQNPQQLERIVLYLIEDLQKSQHYQTAASIFELNHDKQHNKSPTLALIPPEASSVKKSITQSVNAVNVTAAKHIQRKLPKKHAQYNIVSDVSDVSTTQTDPWQENQQISTHSKVNSLDPNELNDNINSNDADYNCSTGHILMQTAISSTTTTTNPDHLKTKQKRYFQLEESSSRSNSPTSTSDLLYNSKSINCLNACDSRLDQIDQVQLSNQICVQRIC